MSSILRRNSKISTTSILHAPSPAILRILLNRLHNLHKSKQMDYRLVEYNDVKYHIRSSIFEPQLVEISILIPSSSQSISTFRLPLGVLEAVKATYGHVLQILDHPQEGFQLTVNLDLSKFPKDKESRLELITKVASLRALIVAAQTRGILNRFSSYKFPSDTNHAIPLIHRPTKKLFLLPLNEKVIFVLPLHFKDSMDAIFATTFLEQFAEAAYGSRFEKAVSFIWAQHPPVEMKSVPLCPTQANAGYVSFEMFPLHMEGSKVDRIVWTLSSFNEYLHYHIKCSKGFIQSLMRKDADNLIEALYQTRLHLEDVRTTIQGVGCMQRLWQPRTPQMPSTGKLFKKHMAKATIPVQLHRIKSHHGQHIAWRCLKALRISTAKKYSN